MQTKSSKKPSSSKLLFILCTVLVFLGIILVNQKNASKNNIKIIQYNDFVNRIKNDQITSIEEKDEFITAIVKENNNEVIYKARKMTDRVGEDDNLMSIIEAKDINLKVQQPTGPNYFLPFMLSLLPFLIILSAGIAGITVIICFFLEEQK